MKKETSIKIDKTAAILFLCLGCVSIGVAYVLFMFVNIVDESNMMSMLLMAAIFGSLSLICSVFSMTFTNSRKITELSKDE